MKKILVALMLSLAAMSVASTPLVARPPAPSNASYTVYYYNVKSPNKVRTYGTYSSYASALKAKNFLNSYPEYRSYIRTNSRN